MAFQNPPLDAIYELLRGARTLAVVGLSDNPLRTSYGVSAAMQRYGYRVLPVNPAIEAALGERAVGSLAEAPGLLAPGERIDIVNVFRRPEHVAEVISEAIRLGLPAVWLQEGVIDEAAALRAQAAGLVVVMDLCIYKLRAQM